MPPGTQADEDPGSDWPAWRQGPGYSRPVPPEPEPGHRAQPGPRHRGERGSHARPGSGSDDEHYAEPPPRRAEQPRRAEPPRYAESSRAEPPRYTGPPPAEPPGSTGPQYSQSPRYAEPSRYPERGPSTEDYAEPGDYAAAPGAYAAAGDHGDGGSSAGAGTYRDAGDYEGPEGYGDPGIYGGPAGSEEPGGYQPPARGRRPTAFLIAVAAVIVAAGAVAAVLLLRHHGPARHAAAGGPPVPSSARTPVSSPGPATTNGPPSAPPLTGADGNLGIPRQVGSLLLNPSLTQRFVGPGVERQDANSFFIPVRDVVSGFYTASPSVTTFTARDPRLMLLVAYLHGSGNIVSALHGFMANHSFYGQQQVNPGPQGGVAACGLLPQQPAPVAHCMWADHNTYADFYAWGSSPAALAQTMIAIRPKIEFAHG